MIRVFALLGVLALTACTTVDVTRSEATTDSSQPLTEGLESYDVEHYTLRNDILIEEKAIAGSSAIRFRALRDMTVLELDFDGLFTIDAIEDGAGALDYTRDNAKVYVSLRTPLAVGGRHTVTVRYHGVPLEAARAPWDGGFVWSKTPSGKPWIATAMQGEGCDIWWPCKDHPAGEPSSMDLYFTVPDELTAASNGVLVAINDEGNGRRTFHWRTNVPTNTYGIALNVAPYVLIEGSYTSSNGTEIPLMFWAIEDHEEKARALFDTEFAKTIEFFERKVGPYPWGQEKLGVAETPHLGMEHQTINAYGNEFRRGEYGFDWLFHHELAHEWFGNVMTHTTVSDMWLHEGFGAYMQPEYAREVIGEAAFYAGMYDTYLKIKACNPIAPREEFSADQLYFDERTGKGDKAGMGEEAFWRGVRRLVYDTVDPATLAAPIEPRFRSTDDYLRIASEEADSDLSWFFEVYARRGPLPVLEVQDTDRGLLLEWQNVGELDFPMPIPVRVGDSLQRVEFDGNRALLAGVRESDVQVDPFMNVLRKLPVVPTCDERLEEEKTARPHR